MTLKLLILCSILAIGGSRLGCSSIVPYTAQPDNVAQRPVEDVMKQVLNEQQRDFIPNSIEIEHTHIEVTLLLDAQTPKTFYIYYNKMDKAEIHCKKRYCSVWVKDAAGAVLYRYVAQNVIQAKRFVDVLHATVEAATKPQENMPQ